MSEIAEKAAREIQSSCLGIDDEMGIVIFESKKTKAIVERAIAESQAPHVVLKHNEGLYIDDDFGELGDGEPSPDKFKAALGLIENYDSSCECDDHTQPECCANVSVTDCFCAHCIAGKALL